MSGYLILLFFAFASGSLAGMYFKRRSSTLAVVKLKQGHHKMSNYRDVVRLMRTMLYFDHYKNYWGEDWDYYGNTDEVLYELTKEWAEMLFHAPPDILKSVQLFIMNPDKDNYNKALVLMRQDLGSGK